MSQLNQYFARLSRPVLKHVSLFALLVWLTGCSMLNRQDEVVVDISDPQYLELKSMLEQQQIEWETQKPALQRLVKNEEDLAFLIDALSNLSVIGTSPSLEQYMLGQPQYAESQSNGKGIAVNDPNKKMIAPTNSEMANKQSGSTIQNPPLNPLASLADSPEELTQLMNELQKLARTVRYNKLNNNVQPQSDDNSLDDQANDLTTRSTYITSNGGIFANSKVDLTDYAQQLAGKLAKFIALEGASVGVASFVDFDETLRSSSSLGNQFAEALATELPQYGVNVVDFKLTKYIDVSSMGDLVLSRDRQKLNGQSEMDYVLTGTLIATHRGVKINSRVVSVKDNSVIAAASTFVPKGLLQQIQP